MALVIVRLQGGPDNGVELGYNVPPPLPASINYVGSIYDRKAGTSNPVIYTFNKTASATGGIGPKAHNGWADLRRSVNRRMPAALNQANRDLDRALRSLSKTRKVKL